MKTGFHPARELAVASTKKTLLHKAGTTQNAGIAPRTVLLNLKTMIKFDAIDLYHPGKCLPYSGRIVVKSIARATSRTVLPGLSV